MKTEKPIKVIPGKGSHPVEKRVFAREIHESYCAKKVCRFFGKTAVQGVCYSTERFDGERDLNKWLALKTKEFTADRNYFHKLYAGKPEKYIQHLEAHYEGAMLNLDLILNELIELRAENAILKDKLDKKSKNKKS